MPTATYSSSIFTRERWSRICTISFSRLVLGAGGSPPEYKPGQPFGQNTTLAPLEIVYPLDKRTYALEPAERLWTRLEYADMEEAVRKRRWRDVSLAKEEAELVLEIALDRE